MAIFVFRQTSREGPRALLFDEIKAGRLRQGWSITDGLNLNKGRDEFIEAAMAAPWEGGPADRKTAQDIYNKIRPILDIRGGDWILIPKQPEPECFTIAQAKGGYDFQSPVAGDFRHCVQVDPATVRTLNYQNPDWGADVRGYLRGIAFSAPVSRVTNAEIIDLFSRVLRDVSVGNKKCAIIAQNDESKWKDDLGSRYHFPRKYKNILVPGTLVVYYKGTLRKRSYASARLSPDAHYFGTAMIGRVQRDAQSQKGDLYCEILNYLPFKIPVGLRRETGELIESVPPTKSKNWFRDGVRRVDLDTFMELSVLGGAGEVVSDQGELSSYGRTEGGKRVAFGTRYERDPRTRREAIDIHGTACQACGFDFDAIYGDWGAGFIHVHHEKPLHQGLQIVVAATDLAVLCPNCHAMVHRKKNQTLTVKQVCDLLRVQLEKRKKF